MREYFTYGSVRGAAGNGGPYRDRLRLTGSSLLRRPPGGEHQLDGFPSRHSDFDAKFSGARSSINDLRIEQVFGIYERALGGSFRDRDCLTKLAGSFDVVDTAPHDAHRGQDRTILSLFPAIADANGAAVVKLHGTRDDFGKGIVHLCVYANGSEVRGAIVPQEVSEARFAVYPSLPTKPVSNCILAARSRYRRGGNWIRKGRDREYDRGSVQLPQMVGYSQSGHR